MRSLQTSALVTGFMMFHVVISGCGVTEEPAAQEGDRIVLDGAIGYATPSPGGDVDVTVVSPGGTQLATGHWEAMSRSLTWKLDDGTSGGLVFQRFSPTEQGTAALVYTQWTAAHPAPQVTCDSNDGTCSTQQGLLGCEFNCMFWTGDSYGSCWCGCNPDQRSCSYGCCL